MIFSMMNVIQSGGVGWAQRYEITRCQEPKTWPSWVATSPGDSTTQPASSTWPHTRLHELLPQDHRQLRQRVPADGPPRKSPSLRHPSDGERVHELVSDRG